MFFIYCVSLDKLLLDAAIIQPFNWTRDGISYGSWSLGYGFLDMQRDIYSHKESGEVHFRVNVGGNGHVILCGYMQTNAFKYTGMKYMYIIFIKLVLSDHYSLSSSFYYYIIYIYKCTFEIYIIFFSFIFKNRFLY